eukprot:1755061-Lingulodinium_polyedra.AAC.1
MTKATARAAAEAKEQMRTGARRVGQGGYCHILASRIDENGRDAIKRLGAVFRAVGTRATAIGMDIEQ